MASAISLNSTENRVVNVHIGDQFFQGTDKIHSLGFHHLNALSHQNLSLGIALSEVPDADSVNVQKACTELAGFDIARFSRPQIAVLLALIVAEKDDLLAKSAQQGLYGQISRGMIESVSKDIIAQGNSALIGSVVTGVAGAVCGAINSYQNIKSTKLNFESSDLNQQAAAASTAASNQGDKVLQAAPRAQELAQLAKESAAKASNAATSALISKLVGDTITGFSSGIVTKVETSFNADQKIQEQDAHEVNALTETTNQEKQRVKEVLSQVLRLLQEILSDQKQVTDSVATMKC